MNDEFASLPFDAFSPDQEAASPSSHLLDELALHGYRPLEDDPDPRSLPTSDAASFALETRRRSDRGLFIDTRLEADLPDLLWSFVNLFHRKAERVGRDLDDNETAQRRSARRIGRLGNPLGRTGATDRARAYTGRTP